MDEDANKNYIANDCYAKTERLTMLRGSQSDSKGTKEQGGIPGLCLIFHAVT